MLAPLSESFAPRAPPSTNLVNPASIRPSVTSRYMKNMFSRDDDLSLDSLWKKPIPSKLDLAQSESLVDQAMNLFSKKEPDSGVKGTDYMQQKRSDMMTALVLGSALILSIAIGTMGVDIPSLSQLITGVEHLFQDPNAFLQGVIQNVESMGPAGVLYFGLFYILAEVLCVPALPLTASAGYLFGLAKGTAVVLTAASVAAAIGFLIGRTFLRDFVEEKLEDYPEFQKIDSAIGKEGFKLMVLLRLSPIFPFSLSNYLYGASSVGFWQYFFGTMIGFAPGTIAYVYSGEIGKALTGGGDAQPWYVYAGGMVFVAGLLKLVADVATTTIQEMEEEAP